MIYLSIIIPVYNSLETIIESIDSVINEFENNSYKWELIIIDDGSKDDSVKIINQYILNSSFKESIKLIKQENSGVAAARNSGLKIAKGNFIAFNDSDDKWLKGKIKIQMDYLLNNPEVDMVAGVFDQDNLSAIPIKKINYATVIKIRDQVIKNYFSPQTTIFRKKILDKVGLFNERMRYAEEGYFFNRMVFFGTCVVLNKIVTKPIIKKDRWGDSGLSGNLKEMEKGELFNIYDAYKSKFIGLGLFMFAITFSLLKYCRRLILKRFRKINFNS